MTAAEVIDEIKHLPPKEQAEVVRFAIDLAHPRLFNLEPWDLTELADDYRDEAVDRDYTIEADMRGQAPPGE
jgi:hypothetical protein